MKIVLKGERPPSWNQFYEGRHWAGKKDYYQLDGSYVKRKKGRHEIAKEIHGVVRAQLIDMGIKVMNKETLFSYKVNITVNSYFKQRWLDSDNIPAKIYIDALKFLLLHDDTPTYVGKVTTESFMDRDNPRTEILITPYE